MAKLQYTRILVKISGEQLAGSAKTGIDPRVVAQVAQEIAQAVAVGAEIVIVVGGGNYVRGAQIQGNGIQRVTGDFMGMLATLMNAIALRDIFNLQSVPAVALTNLIIDQVADQFTQRRALHHLGKGRVVIVGGGIGRPYLTTDTSAVNLALELDCDLVCKITKVDGVYDKDPAEFPDAKLVPTMTFQEALENPQVLVMDKAALGLALEHKKPIVVCNLHQMDNLKHIVLGQPVGTLIS